MINANSRNERTYLWNVPKGFLVKGIAMLDYAVGECDAVMRAERETCEMLEKIVFRIRRCDACIRVLLSICLHIQSCQNGIRVYF